MIWLLLVRKSTSFTTVQSFAAVLGAHKNNQARHHQEQLDFAIFPVFVILTSLSAKSLKTVSQKCSLLNKMQKNFSAASGKPRVRQPNCYGRVDQARHERKSPLLVMLATVPCIAIGNNAWIVIYHWILLSLLEGGFFALFWFF